MDAVQGQYCKQAGRRPKAFYLEEKLIRSLADRSDVLDDDSRRTLRFLQQRGSPRLFITDRSGAVLFCSTELAGSSILSRSREAVKNFLAREESIETTHFEYLEPLVILRIMPLAGERDGCCAVMIEPFSSRNSLESAVKRFDITKRQSDVLELLLAGHATSEIARRLFISDGTVGDHIKSLFRKTNTNKRSELIARLFHHEADRLGNSALPDAQPAETAGRNEYARQSEG